MFELSVDYKSAQLKKWEKLTSGSVGVKLRFKFSPEWDGLVKTVCFANGKDRLPSVTLRDDTIEIPHEAMERPDVNLRAGVYGETPDGTLVIPTIYASLGIICQGARKTGRPSVPSTPDWTAGVEADVSRAVETAKDVERRANAGEFNGTPGRSPKIGANTDWFVWDNGAEAWVDTGVYSGGQAPYIGTNGNWFAGMTDTGVKADGISPDARVEETAAGAVVTVTDRSGTTTANLTNGEDGITPNIGTNGNWFVGTADTGIHASGDDGFSPGASVTETADGADISITDKTGTTTAHIKNGIDSDITKAYTDSTFANAIKKTVSGTVITADDVSPVEHDITCKISSDTVTDLTAVNVTECGKNLYNQGEMTFSRLLNDYHQFANLSSAGLVGKKITYQAEIDNTQGTGESRINCWTLQNGSVVPAPAAINSIAAGETGISKITFTVPDCEKILPGAFLYGDTGHPVTIRKFQISFEDTAYTPYTGQNYTPAADGTVEGMTSVSPYMTILTDTAGVTITATYNQDTEKVLNNIEQQIPDVGALIEAHNTDSTAHSDIRQELNNKLSEVPTMSESVKGGAKVGNGLKMAGDVLSVDDGEWELIEDVTFAEDAILERTSEPNGTLYRFKALQMEFKFPKTDSANTTTAINVEFSNSANMQIGYWSKVLDSLKYAQSTVTKNFGYWTNYYFQECDSEWAFKNPYFLGYHYSFNVHNEYITKIYSRGAIPSGTEIKIWAVRL